MSIALHVLFWRKVFHWVFSPPFTSVKCKMNQQMDRTESKTMSVISIDFNLFWVCSPLHCGSGSSSGPTVIEQWLFSLHLSMEAMESALDACLPTAWQLYFASLILQKQIFVGFCWQSKFVKWIYGKNGWQNVRSQYNFQPFLSHFLAFLPYFTWQISKNPNSAIWVW